MKKMIVFPLLALFFLSLVSAIDVEVGAENSDAVLVRGFGGPILFDLEINNSGPADDFRFHNLVGSRMAPESFRIGEGETKNVRLSVFPREDFDYRDEDSFYYFIKSESTSETKEGSLAFRTLNVEDALEIGSEGFDTESDSVTIFVENAVNFGFDELDVKFSSHFFERDEERSFSLGPMEKRTFQVDLDGNRTRDARAGFYTLAAEISVGNETRKTEGSLDFVRTESLNESIERSGFFVPIRIIGKTNEGNVPVDSRTEVRRNVFSRLFTSFSEEPDSVERRGLNFYYVWSRQINPGETFVLETRTNWIFPLLLFIFLAAIAVMARIYYRRDLEMKKKISLVRTKGGEFALKVSIFLEAKNPVKNVGITDRYPVIVRIHDEFGVEKPTKINVNARTVRWDFEKLDAGEKKVISYIVYSKVGVLGKFELPAAEASYAKKGRSKSANSNRAFFLSEAKEEDNL